MQPLKPIRILYMEDDKGLARLLQRKMRREGYDVDMIYDGLKGLAILAKQAYDVLLVDHKMPGFSGLEVIRRLAAGAMLPPTG
jgi:DNA-binding response OmpR family regulator